MNKLDIHTQVQQAILQERGKRGYNVIVEYVRPSCWIADVPIPRELQAYSALTTCTERHERNIQCIWADFAFVLKDRIHVVLQNDLSCPGFTLEDNVRMIFESLVESLR